MNAVNLNGPSRVDSLWRALQQVVLPPRCLLCRQRGAARDLCDGCAADLQRNRSACARCALPLASAAQLCGECLKSEPAFDSAWAPYIYSHPFDLLLTQFKFGHSLAAGRVLGELCIEAMAERCLGLPQLLLPVPLHPQRLRERGYNQALEFTRPLARAFGIPLCKDWLLRQRDTPAQTNLDAKARRRNLHGAFHIVENAALPPHVAIVDDVMTTGATLRECAKTLKRAGVTQVEVWAAARAPRGRSTSA